MKVIAIIPAGGKGIRSGFSTPKQYLKHNNKEIITYCLETFQKNRLIDEIIISAEPDYFNLLIRLVKKSKLKKVKTIVEGGSTRQQSVYNALLSLDAKNNDLIVVHDAARPLLPQNTLSNAIALAKKKGNAVVCIKAKDTLIKGNDIIFEYLNRDEIYYVQTPQIFKYEVLLKAFQKAEQENFIGTDESSLVKKIDEEIYISEGSVFNFKITTKEDLELFKKILKRNSSLKI
ncbi:MAG: 2-C-methyl-D-erythritol 4-phosphate cytidylyltransferase [Ignavibacterium sp.]|nr:2-C-methyl-D-erythritol 4-phosphate cytidylyltransferase [Ignavibacterium sp.]MDW8374805.1 2-C-methyl-D-erythritol 4-phosphate cytidylyltransferase [Ignavibacteriales bacterium]